MISRFKWYAVRLPSSKAEAFKKLEDYKYGAGLESGFIVDRLASSFEYYWKTPLYAISINDDGEATRSEIFSVSRQQVGVIGNEKLVLRIQDPPRSSKELFNALEKVLGFGFGCSALVANDALIKQAVCNFHSVVLNSIKFSGGVSDISALARVELVSKQGLDVGSLGKFGLDNRTVESASYSVKYKGLSGQVGFTRTGLCKISGDLTPLILSNVESFLLSALD